MDNTGNETLDRIQQEIQESLKREEELRSKYTSLNNNHEKVQVNGNSPEPPILNGSSSPGTQNPKYSGRIFAPNPSSKGMMQKFLKMRGKLNTLSLRPRVEPQVAWVGDTFEPAKVTMENGKLPRNGFVSAVEKMKRELLEFQQREEELRNERRKSQPNLMAALEKEESSLKETCSEGVRYSSEDLTSESSAPGTLKRARSLAELLDAEDEELDAPGTHSLIMQFESMRSQS